MCGIPKRDLTGQKFGKLTAIRKIFWYTANTRWLCKCDCGQEVEKFLGSLTRGAATHCGCSSPGRDSRPSKEQLAADLSSIKLIKDVAKKYRVTYTTIYRWKKFYRLGTATIGTKHWAAKLTDEDVKLIRDLVSQGIQAKEVAEKFEVSEACISNIINFSTYRNVV